MKMKSIPIYANLNLWVDTINLAPLGLGYIIVEQLPIKYWYTNVYSNFIWQQ